MKCIINGKIVLKDKVLEGYSVVFDNKIQDVVRTEELKPKYFDVIDAKGGIITPGLIDMHIHGYLGEDVSDGKAEGIRKIASGIIKNGVTSWCPTTMTVSVKEIEAAFDAVREVKSSDEFYGAKIVGVNSEGPFINPSKKGAQAEEHILKPDGDFIIKHSDIVKLFTVAPEMDGARECIEKVKANGNILISMGHTNATYDEAVKGIEWGVASTTHLFNAMSPLSHRTPGVVGAALSEDVYTELIADTFHVDKGLFNMVAKAKGDRLILITDCIRAGGMDDGDYTLGGQALHKEGIKCLMADGTIAGSVLTLNMAVKNLYENSQLSICDAVRCATLNPAAALGIDKYYGSIEEGKCADLVVFDNDFNVCMTICDGEIRYRGE